MSIHRILIALAIASALWLADSAGQRAQAYGCGLPPLPPLPPLGCHQLAPVCVCNPTGQCWWEFQCVR